MEITVTAKSKPEFTFTPESAEAALQSFRVNVVSELNARFPSAQLLSAFYTLGESGLTMVARLEVGAV